MGESSQEPKTPEQLKSEGWKPASVSGGQHLQRTLQMYEELGIEVYVEELDPKTCEGCTACYESGDQKMYRVYTR